MPGAWSSVSSFHSIWMIPRLIEAVKDDLTRVTADAAYDTVAFYDAASARGATVVVPPAKTSRVSRRRPRSMTPGGRTTAVLLAWNMLNAVTDMGRPDSYAIGR